MLWVVISHLTTTNITPNHPHSVTKSIYDAEEGTNTDTERGAQSLRDLFQQEIPPESLYQLSLSLKAPGVVREGGRSRLGGTNASKNQKPDSN